MDKPYWQIKHDWWEEDFAFEVSEKDFYAGLLRKHVDDPSADMLREIIKMIDKRLKELKRGYKKVYGVSYNMNRLKDREKMSQPKLWSDRFKPHTPFLETI